MASVFLMPQEAPAGRVANTLLLAGMLVLPPVVVVKPQNAAMQEAPCLHAGTACDAGYPLQNQAHLVRWRRHVLRRC
jgi:hypothetical protein